MLQKLSGTAFTTMKYLAKDPTWMNADDNGETLLSTMDLEENFGEDCDEDLISSLAKVTFHLRRGRDETHRAFFTRWDNAMRKVKEHQVSLPGKYEGFLLINGLGLNDSEIKHCLNYTRGSIEPRDVRNWVRKHETKLQVSQVGVDKDKKTVSSSKHATHYIAANDDTDDDQDEEIYALEEAISELTGKSDGLEEPEEIYSIEESEAAELLSTVLAKKKTYMQTLKAKKSKELGRGYAGPSGSGSSAQSRNRNGKFVHSGNGTVIFNKDGKQVRMTLEEVKKITKMLELPQGWTLAQGVPGEGDQGAALAGDGLWGGLLLRAAGHRGQPGEHPAGGRGRHRESAGFTDDQNDMPLGIHLSPGLSEVSETAAEPSMKAHEMEPHFETVGALGHENQSHFGGSTNDFKSDSRYDCIQEVLFADTIRKGAMSHETPDQTICEDLCATIDTDVNAWQLAKTRFGNSLIAFRQLSR